MHLKWCIIYLDDITVFSKTPAEHIQRLRGVFKMLSAAGLQLKSSKCEFVKSHIKYLGHLKQVGFLWNRTFVVESFHLVQ